MNIINLVFKGIIRLKKEKFIRQFQSFDIHSAIGTDGAGKDCIVVGARNISVGKESSFGSGCELIALESHFNQQLKPALKIGDHVRVTARCRITCTGKITIEDDVLMAPDVFITDHNHGMNPEHPGGYSPQALIVKDVKICQGVWLGQRVCVLPGVTIGAHSIIGANSVVTHDIPPYSIAVGAPARVVKVWNHNTKKWVSTH